MQLSCRYADGQAAIVRDAQCEFGAEGLTISFGEARIPLSYDELRRADDGNGRIVFKRKPDTGERLSFEGEMGLAIQDFAPKLFKPRAQGVEGLGVVGGLAAGAWATAAAFLVGIPMLAGQIADFMPQRVRTQIAEVSWSQVNLITGTCQNADAAEQILNAVAYRMMEQSDVAQRDEIWISIVSTDTLDSPFPNAFALPDQSIIVTDDLIAMAEHPDEITGVIAHEIAHIEHNHVLKGIIRSVGAGIFFDVVFGGSGAGQAVAIASVNLSSLRFSRGDEADADSRGLDYLDSAGISSAGLARLFERIEELYEGEGEAVPKLLSSHPASGSRAAAARARARTGLSPSMTDAEWRTVRTACGGTSAPSTEGGAPLAPAAPQTPAPPAPAAESASDKSPQTLP